MIEDLVKQVNSLQKQVDALVKPEVNRWMDWSPTFAQGVAVNATINYARYTVIGNVVHIICKVTFTSAGTGGSLISLSDLPYGNANATNEFQGVIGFFEYTDTGTANYLGFVYSTASTGGAFLDSVTKNFLGINPNFAVANTDEFGFNLTYEKA